MVCYLAERFGVLDRVPVLPLVSAGEAAGTSGAESVETREDFLVLSLDVTELALFLLFLLTTLLGVAGSSLGAKRKYEAISTATIAVV